MVTASYPAFARQGQTIDVVVSSMGNAKSLRGGTLLMTPLKGVDSRVCSGAGQHSGWRSRCVGGRQQRAGEPAERGRITNGAIIERELPTQFGTGNTINLQLNNEDFTMAQQIADTINRSRGYGSATALDARTVQIRTSTGSSNRADAGRYPEYGSERAGSGCESHYQLPYRLGGDEPRSDAGQLRRGAGQSPSRLTARPTSASRIPRLVAVRR